MAGSKNGSESKTKTKKRRPGAKTVKETPPIEPLSPDQWREGSVYLVALPSGKAMRLKRIGLMDLIKQGSVPQYLTAITEAAMSTKVIDELSIVQLEQYAEILDRVLCAAAVEPKVVLELEEGEELPEDTLLANEVETVDKLDIFQWCNGVTSTISSFRANPTDRNAQIRRYGSGI